MKFYVYSRQAIEAIAPFEESHVIVSIRTPGDPNEVRLPLNERTIEVLHLQFHDLDRVVEGYSDHLETQMFQPSHAKQVNDLVKRNKDVEAFVVHCDAGISRSAAVAAAVSKSLTGEDASFFKRYHPNMRVYNMILNQDVLLPTSAWGTDD